MIPAEEDREQPLGDYGRGALGDLFADALHFREMLALLPRGDDLGDGHRGVAEVGDPVAEVLEASRDAGVTDGARSHIYATSVLAEIHGYTEDPDLLVPVLRQRQSPPNDGGRLPPRSVRPAFA